MTNSEQLDLVFSALSNSTRREMLHMLAQKPATVNELAVPFEMTLPAVSKHIRVLEAAGLIVRGKEAQFRPCSLNAEPLEAVASWAEQYRHVWEMRFNRMDDYLLELKGKK